MRDNPWMSVHYACEMTRRECLALMTRDDWELLLHKALARYDGDWKLRWLSSGKTA